jgi:hypothetical protein
MLGSGIIFSVFKGEGAPETDKILDFCRSAVGCVSDNACLSERGKGGVGNRSESHLLSNFAKLRL